MISAVRAFAEDDCTTKLKCAQTISDLKKIIIDAKIENTENEILDIEIPSDYKAIEVYQDPCGITPSACTGQDSETYSTISNYYQNLLREKDWKLRSAYEEIIRLRKARQNENVILNRLK